MFVIHFPVFGGPHNQALRLTESLRRRRFETIVVVPDGSGNAAERLRTAGIDVKTLQLHRLRATADVRTHLRFAMALPTEVERLRRVIRAERIDIVQIGGLANPHAAIAARLEGVPVVWQLLDTRTPRPVAIAAMAFVRALADTVMSTGLAVAQAHPGYQAIANRVVTFFPPVDVDRFAPRPELRGEVRAAWGIPESGLVIGCVANINPQKGILDLVDAFAQVRVDHPNVRLVVVGADYATHATYSAEVRARVARHRLIDGVDVIFVGERNDVERQLAGMDVVALAASPRSEGITTAVLEGMAVGLPAVVTDVGALREAVSDRRTGFVTPAGDVGAFARALVSLLDDPRLREQMGQEARRVAVEKFGVEASADAHVRAYRQALGLRGRRGVGMDLAVNLSPPDPALAQKVVLGIPVFLPDLRAAGHDELDHHHADGHKAAQVSHFDRSNEEAFEITRPRGTPRLYRFLLSEKFAKAVTPIRPQLVGASALVVCGGSGMDAEFLVKAGAAVTTSDLSMGAATRARARSIRYGLGMLSIVADVEHLPYPDQSIDLVAVHDGLHHLDDPYPGLSEMARVARRWVIVTEPAQASVTRLAIRLGMALETEEAGNRVARMDPIAVAAFLEDRGFATLRAERYAMYYPHRPGPVFRILSRPIVFPLVRAGWGIANALIGRYGNKMVVVAERIDRRSP